MSSSRLAETRIRLLRDGAVRRDLIRLRQRAYGANLTTLGDAVNDVCSQARILSIERAAETARLARLITREADRLVGLGRLRAYEHELVDRGLAEWLDGDDA